MSARPEQPVAVFDSGVGGLTVLHELLVSLPTEDYVYLGDTARFPYGERTQRELRAFAIEIAEHLLELGAKLLVVACNAASSAALGALEHYVESAGRDVDVIGVVAPATQLAVAGSPDGTDRPARDPGDGAQRRVRTDRPGGRPHVHLESVACPDLAPIIQGGFPFDESTVETVRALLRAAPRGAGRHGDPRLHPLPAGRADAAALARSRRDARQLRRRRRSQRRAGAGGSRAQNPQTREGDYRFRCTGDVESFRALGSRFLQMPLGEVVHVELAALGRRMSTV